MDAPAGKDRARAYFKKVRTDLGERTREGLDAAIAERILATDAYRTATAVLTYLSTGAEVDTRRIIERAWADGRIVAIPRCAEDAHVMSWHRIESFEELERGAHGIDEPPADPATLIDIDALGASTASVDPLDTSASGSPAIALVPGLAFDVAGNRIGYGGGFFDAFLAGFAGTSIGLCREAQLVPSLREIEALEAHDAPVDIVVTESRTVPSRQ